nr:proline-rich receptor-like protein kinase PERK2 [Penaeus vannamei]
MDGGGGFVRAGCWDSHRGCLCTTPCGSTTPSTRREPRMVPLPPPAPRPWRAPSPALLALADAFLSPAGDGEREGGRHHVPPAAAHRLPPPAPLPFTAPPSSTRTWTPPPFSPSAFHPLHSHAHEAHARAHEVGGPKLPPPPTSSLSGSAFSPLPAKTGKMEDGCSPPSPAPRQASFARPPGLARPRTAFLTGGGAAAAAVAAAAVGASACWKSGGIRRPRGARAPGSRPATRGTPTRPTRTATSPKYEGIPRASSPVVAIVSVFQAPVSPIPVPSAPVFEYLRDGRRTVCL